MHATIKKLFKDSGDLLSNQFGSPFRLQPVYLTVSNFAEALLLKVHCYSLEWAHPEKGTLICRELTVDELTVDAGLLWKTPNSSYPRQSN